MVKEYSPFTPGVPVPPEFFVGREAELEKMLSHIKKCSAKGSLERIFLVGERGIGKSSLSRTAMTIAERDFDTLGIHVLLGGVSTLEEMVRRIFHRLLQESREQIWFKTVKEFLGNHVKEVGIFGVSLQFDASEAALKQAVSDFVPALRNLLGKLKQQRKRSLMIVLDDLNGLAGNEAFAHWLKSIVDEIATSRDPLALTLVLVGLPDRRRQLIEHQPSLDRVFDLIDIKRFSEQETREFYTKAFGTVNVSVTEEALRVLWTASGGYPAFLHEIGDAVFKEDDDNMIGEDDALAGIVHAARVIGDKYIEPQVLAAIWSKRYRGILKKMVTQPFECQFAKADLNRRLSKEESRVLDNFLQKLKQLGVLTQDPQYGRGQYRFTSEMVALFFWLQARADGRQMPA